MRKAGLRALEAQGPGPKAVPREKSEELAPKLSKRVAELEQEVRELRKGREHWKLVAETGQRIIRRNAWKEEAPPPCKKNGTRSRKPGDYASGNGQ